MSDSGYTWSITLQIYRSIRATAGPAAGTATAASNPTRGPRSRRPRRSPSRAAHPASQSPARIRAPPRAPPRPSWRRASRGAASWTERAGGPRGQTQTRSPGPSRGSCGGSREGGGGLKSEDGRGRVTPWWYIWEMGARAQLQPSRLWQEDMAAVT